MSKFDHSSGTTRKIGILHRWATKLEHGETLTNPAYLHAIADEMERVYRLAIERGVMGAAGTDTGLKDRFGWSVHIGDTVEFDPQQWGGELRFTVKYDPLRGCLDIPGVADDAAKWWAVLHHNGYPLGPVEQP